MYDNEHFDTSIIQPKPSIRDIRDSNNILNSIVQHPYIEHLDHNINGFSHLPDRSKINLKILMYRISHLNGHHYVEYYTPNSSLLTIPALKNTNDTTMYLNNDETIIEYVNTHLASIPGIKRYKGYLLHHTEIYLIVQSRNNDTTDGWSVIWDILANKHLYGIQYDSSTLDFFIRHHKLSHLYVDNKMCILPTVLYCQVPTNKIDYIRKHKSCQYVQRENTPLIELHLFSIQDNVRNLCFIKDTDLSKTYLDIEMNDYIILNEHKHNIYVFKQDNNVLSFVKG